MEDYTWVQLLQPVCLMENSPNHKEMAIRKIYSGMPQTSSENLSTYLERVRQTGEDAFGLSSNWTNNNATTVLNVIITGVRNKPLSSLIATYIILMPVNFSTIKQHIVQFEGRVQPTPRTEINALNARNDSKAQKTVCFRCSGEHLITIIK